MGLRERCPCQGPGDQGGPRSETSSERGACGSHSGTSSPKAENQSSGRPGLSLSLLYRDECFCCFESLELRVSVAEGCSESLNSLRHLATNPTQTFPEKSPPARFHQGTEWMPAGCPPAGATEANAALFAVGVHHKPGTRATRAARARRGQYRIELARLNRTIVLTKRRCYHRQTRLGPSSLIHYVTIASFIHKHAVYKSAIEPSPGHETN